MKSLSEYDICAKFITPALSKAGWNETQIRREVTFTAAGTDKSLIADPGQKLFEEFRRGFDAKNQWRMISALGG